MKTDSAVMADKKIGLVRDGADELAAADHERRSLSHDLRASLAIVNGYSAALGTSFQELTRQYRIILEADAPVVDPESADRLLMLEADCRFCLSRLCTSIDQLKHRLRTKHDLAGPTEGDLGL